MATRNILVANSKGGCGKTTVATNLAAAYANAGQRVALFDCDAQASARHWAQCRDGQRSNIDLYCYPEPNQISAPIVGDYDVCIFDSAPGLTTKPVLRKDFESLLRLADAIVVPMLASAWDIQAGEQFIAQLMTQRVWRAAPAPIAVVSNRVNGNLTSQQKLQHFLSCLDIPAVTQFRESPVYAEASDSGLGVIEMKLNRAARKEFKAWHTLTDWLDHAAIAGQRAGQQTRRPALPLAAPKAPAANPATTNSDSQERA